MKENEGDILINDVDEDVKIIDFEKFNPNKLYKGKIIEKLLDPNEKEKSEEKNDDEIGPLISFMKDAKKELKSEKNKGTKKIDDVYKDYLNTEFIIKDEIRENINDFTLKFIFFVIGPLYGIIYLIGIFLMKSMMNSLGDLVKDSTTMFFKCIGVSNCTISTNNNETSVYDFYNYYYDYTNKETVDFQLTLLTSFIGGLLLNSKGFRVTTGLLFIPSVGATIWLWNFDFKFKVDGQFDYDILKIINLIIIFILLFCGIGGSALLTQQILTEGHLKYKNNLLKKNVKKRETLTNYYKNVKPLNIKNKEDLIKEIEEREERSKKNTFQFFFMICLITIIGYLGKYLTILLLDYILKHTYRENYDKKLFFIYTITLYAISILLSLILYSLYKICIFEDKEEENEQNEVVKISQICGYTIYSKTRKLENNKEKNQENNNQNMKENKQEIKGCCKLCCESIYNCCDKTFCNLIKGVCSYIYSKPPDYSCCYCCKYDRKDYKKPEEVFYYCYKTKRKFLWCNDFFANDTQKKIFPYMLEYFILQLTTIGFEKQYEIYKNKNIHIKTWISIFVLSFILFFYFSLSFNKIFFHIDKNTNNNKNDGIRISNLSKNILRGTHGILIFNSVFSVIFSFIYLFYKENDIKALFFEDNLNIIFMPILMNKYYYFTLNYYCTSTGEDNKKFEIISNSVLVSLYITIWNSVISLIKTIVPDETTTDGNDYNNILFIIQMVFSSFPFLAFIIFILYGFGVSSGIFDCMDDRCACSKCKILTCLQFFGWLFSCFFCFGGLWIRRESFKKYKLDCCSLDECCDVRCQCNVFCIDNKILICDCCCCGHDEKNCCHSDYCEKHCNIWCNDDNGNENSSSSNQ